jgi:hypothetical protein
VCRSASRKNGYEFRLSPEFGAKPTSFNVTAAGKSGLACLNSVLPEQDVAAVMMPATISHSITLSHFNFILRPPELSQVCSGFL